MNDDDRDPWYRDAMFWGFIFPFGVWLVAFPLWVFGVWPFTYPAAP